MKNPILKAMISFVFCAFITNTDAQVNTGIGTTNPNSKLTVNGSLSASYNQITASAYTMNANDFFLVYNGATAGTITLPTAATGDGTTAAATNPSTGLGTNLQGRLYYIKNTTAAQTLTVMAAGSETIDGSATVDVPPGQSVQVISTGLTGTNATWEIVAFNNAVVSGNVCQGFGARSVSGSQAFPNTELTKILFTGEDWDQGNVFNPATGSFTVAQAGRYTITGSVVVDQASTPFIENISIFKNNAALAYGSTSYIISGSGTSQQVSYIADLAVGDVIDLRSWRSGASTTVVLAYFSAIKSDCGDNTGGGGSTSVTASNGLTASSNNVVLGGTLNNATDIATAGNDLTVSGTGNVGIGTTTPTTKLDVNGQVSITDGTEGAGKVLTSDAAGGASWQNPLSGSMIEGTTGNLVTVSASGAAHTYSGGSMTFPKAGTYMVYARWRMASPSTTHPSGTHAFINTAMSTSTSSNTQTGIATQWVFISDGQQNTIPGFRVTVISGQTLYFWFYTGYFTGNLQFMETYAIGPF